MPRFTFYTEDSGRGEGACGVCGEDFKQSTPPELRHVKSNKGGKEVWLHLQCCIKCLRNVDENTRIERAIKEHDQIRQQDEARAAIAVAAKPTREPEPVGAVESTGRTPTKKVLVKSKKGRSRK